MPIVPPGPACLTNPASSGAWDLANNLHTQGAPGWPVSSLVDGLSCEANPGRIDPDLQPIRMSKSVSTISIQCTEACSGGASHYGIYEGSLSSLRTGVYDHLQVDCNAACPADNVISPDLGDRYFLMVPYNTASEGGYGMSMDAGISMDRPQAVSGSRCVEVQTLTTCP